MRFQPPPWPLALVLLSAISIARQAAGLPSDGIARFRDALIHIQDHDADGCYAVADDELARIGKEIEQALHVPATWHVVLRNVQQDGTEMNRNRTKFIPEMDMVWTTLADHSDRQIDLRVTLDAHWVILGSALFIGPDGQTDFTRAQYRDRTGFFPLHAIPIVLDRLEAELRTLPLENSSLKYLSLESGQPLGESPSVRCILGLEGKGTAKPVETELNGVVLLPATAAHERGFKFAGDKGTGDSVIGPVTSSKSVGQCIREAHALSEAILSGGDWSAHVFHNNGSDRFPALVRDGRNLRAKEHQIDLRIDSSGFVGDKDELSASVAGVPLSSAGVSAFLTKLGTAYDPKQTDIFVILGCADRHEIVVVFTSADAPPPYKPDATSIRLVFDEKGTKIEHEDRVSVSRISRRNEDPYTRWTCQFADDSAADVWIRHSEMCGNGIDFTSRCRIGDTPCKVAGGILESTLRNDK